MKGLLGVFAISFAASLGYFTVKIAASAIDRALAPPRQPRVPVSKAA